KFTLNSPDKPNIKNKSVVQNSPISTIPGLLVLPDSQVAKIAADSAIAAHGVESISVKDAKQAQALYKKMRAVIPKDTNFVSYTKMYQ
ncbi:hypothetical protein JT73_14565, partial [Listeria monocytogenes]